MKEQKVLGFSQPRGWRKDLKSIIFRSWDSCERRLESHPQQDTHWATELQALQLASQSGIQVKHKVFLG